MKGETAVDPLAHQSAACELRAEAGRDGNASLLVDCVVVLAGEHPSAAASTAVPTTWSSVGPATPLAISRVPPPGPAATAHCPTVLQTRARARRRDQQPLRGPERAAVGVDSPLLPTLHHLVPLRGMLAG